MACVSSKATSAETLSVGALSMAIAICNFALVVFQLALKALPSRVAPALPVLVITIPRTQNRANTYKKRGAIKPVEKSLQTLKSLMGLAKHFLTRLMKTFFVKVTIFCTGGGGGGGSKR